MNTSQLRDLPTPSFDDPPIVEVVVGAQFSEPIVFRSLEVADLWEKFGKKAFPSYAEQPPLDSYKPDNVQIIEMSPLPPMRRYWFEAEDQSDLIQIQQDRLIYNWRRPPANFSDKNCYPRFETLMDKFHKFYDGVEASLKEQKREHVSPSYLELAYLNFMPIDQDDLSEINKIFKDIEFITDKRLMPTPENINHTVLYNIPDLPLKLRATLKSKQNIRDGSFGVQYELAVVGPIINEYHNNMLEWYSDARLWITHAFADTTSDDMHKLWKRTR